MSKTFSHPSFCLLNKSKLFFWWRDRKRNNSEFLKKRRFCLVSHEFSLLFSVISNSNFTKLHQIVIKRCVKEKKQWVSFCFLKKSAITNFNVASRANFAKQDETGFGWCQHPCSIAAKKETKGSSKFMLHENSSWDSAWFIPHIRQQRVKSWSMLLLEIVMLNHFLLSWNTRSHDI